MSQTVFYSQVVDFVGGAGPAIGFSAASASCGLA